MGDGAGGGGPDGKVAPLVGVMALWGTGIALRSGVGEGSLKVTTSDPLPVAGNAENGPSLFPTRLFGGLPRVFPLALLPPILQAEDTTLAP